MGSDVVNKKCPLTVFFFSAWAGGEDAALSFLVLTFCLLNDLAFPVESCFKAVLVVEGADYYFFVGFGYNANKKVKEDQSNQNLTDKPNDIYDIDTDIT